MANENNINRRRFLKTAANTAAAAIGFPYVVSSSVLGKAARPAPSNLITIGCIGIGEKRGTAVMTNFLSQNDVHVVAVCDVRTHMCEAAQQKVNTHYQSTGCTAYNDFRQLLARNDIDAVMIATPDHWHVPIALAAAAAGKDIYLEKPMGLSIAEDLALRDACNRYNTVFQFGTQQRSDWKFRFACELVRNGRIGKLQAINVWCPPSKLLPEMKLSPVPKWLDYDMWLGPAPYVPYTKGRCSNRHWWFISDYSLGFIAGWGVHPLDIALWGAGSKLAGPVEIEGEASIPAEGVCDTPIDWKVICKYDSGITVDFRSDPPPYRWQQRYRRATEHATVFEGTDGWVKVDRELIDANPKSLLDTVIRPNEIQLKRSNNHARDFLDCVKTRSKTISPIDVAVRSDILCHLCDISTKIGYKLKWDPDRESFVNNDRANRMLTRAMRSPWHL